MLGLLLKSKKGISHARILVVDDEPDLVNTIKTRLEWSHFKVITAGDGQEGLDTAVAKKPDLILLDNNMPVMTGLEMLAKLRETDGIKETPVIMVTAVSEPEKIANASGMGIVDYVTKPFDFSELIDKITKALEK